MLDSVTMSGNTANGAGAGGAVSVFTIARVEARRSTFVGNSAPQGVGGAIYLNNGTLVLKDVEVRNNTSVFFGGGRRLRVRWRSATGTPQRRR
jgi:hypothetical protein